MPSIRRTTLLALTLLIAVAAVGPACLVLMKSRSVERPLVASIETDRGCGDAPAGSLSGCRHENPALVTQAPALADSHLEALLLHVAATATAPRLEIARVLSSASAVPHGAVVHSTPLRT